MPLQLPIYLDHHATTPVDGRVLAAMWPFFGEKFGNAASLNHAFGQEARGAVEMARDGIAKWLRVDRKTLVFTSGATEANNLALKGVLRASPPGSHLIVNAGEHKAVLDPAKRLQRQGFEVTVLPVDRFGQVDPQQVRESLLPTTRLVSVMWANNEVGTINPIHDIGEICRERGVLLHVDAAQAVGKLEIDLSQTAVDLLSISGHKLYAPKGIGVLYVRRGGGPRIKIEPLFDGGGHEQHLRSGTLPVPMIVGLGKACEIARDEGGAETIRVAGLRDRLWERLQSEVAGVVLNGHPEGRLAGNLNVSFEGVDGEALMMRMTHIAVSSGSACTTANPEPSHVLRAMRVSDTLARASLRFGLGRGTTVEEVEFAAEYVGEVVRELQGGTKAAG